MLHHNFRKGQRIFIILNNGIKIVDRFMYSKSKYIELEKQNIHWKDIRSITIRR